MAPPIQHPIHTCQCCGTQLKRCTACGVTRPTAAFRPEYKRATGILRAKCNECINAERRVVGRHKPRGNTAQPRAARFWKKVDAGGADACWPWLGYVARDGYGKFGRSTEYNRAPMAAHRVSWELTHGPIPDGLLVCHKCDNRRCVNPAHLFLGTHRDNTQDMIRKGRRPRTAAPPTTLTRQQALDVVAARAGGMAWRTIAKRFGTTYSSARRAVLRVSRDHGARPST